MTKWLRIFGSLLIALGISVFVGSCLFGVSLYIYSLFQAADYVSGITLTSIFLIGSGYILKRLGIR